MKVFLAGILFFIFYLGKAQRQNLLPDTITLCAGDSASIEIDLRGEAKTRWQTPSGVITNTRRIKVFRQGKVQVQVTYESGAPTLRDSSFIKILARPRKALQDTVICAGTQLSLDAKNPGMRYQWKGGEKSQQINVKEEGVYWVKISNGRCHLYDTARVRVIGVSDPLKEKELVFCLNEPRKILSVKIDSSSRVEWNTGPLTPTMTVTREGTYRVRILHPVCADVTDSVKVKFRACGCEIMIPNSFTPNEDNRNDYFLPVLSCDYSYYHLVITDRWGNPVYESRDPAGRWDGRFKGNLCPEDIYMYTLETTEQLSGKKDVRKGYISLFR